MPSRIDIVVVVVAYHADPWLKPCLAFLRGTVEKDVRVVVGDNYGNTVVRSFVDGKRIVSVALPGPLGFAEANNRTLVDADCFDAPFVCFLNQDTKSPVGWLTRAARFLQEQEDIGAITPLISNYEGDAWDPSFLACTNTLRSFLEDIKSIRTAPRFFEVPVIPASAMVVSTSVLRKVGGFDPIYGSYYEDYDLCRRIRCAGYRVGIWTGATIAHFSGSATASPRAERLRQRLIVRNRIIYRVRTAPEGRGRQLVIALLRELPRQLARGLLGRPAAKPVRTLIGGYGDALRLLPRLLSAQRDEQIRREYFEAIGWPLEPLSIPRPSRTGRTRC